MCGTVRVGLDLLAVDEVGAARARFGQRYLDTVFTVAEQRDCLRDGAVADQRLATRFAAKEAVVKVLRPVDGGPRWPEVEIRPDGPALGVHLSGAARAAARRQGIGPLAVSVSHEAGIAAAVAIATVDPQSATNRKRQH